MSQSPVAIILGFDINGLGVVRSLGKKNIKSVVICPNKDDPSNHSNYPMEKKIFDYKGDYDSDLLKLLIDFNYANKVLIPTSDKTVEFMDRNRSILKKYYKLAIPGADAISLLIDKKIEVDYISKSGVHCPRTELELYKGLHKDIKFTYPLLVKPRMYKDCSIIKKKNILLNTQEELKNFEQMYYEKLHRFIIQEVILGEDSNQWVCNCVFDSSSNLASAFTFRRLHLSPAHFGVTSMARSELNLDVIEYAKKIGRRIRYVGPAMIEFKYDVNDDKYKYIELNPRLGMCNYFDTACGVNSAYYSFQVALGNEDGQDFNPKQKINYYFLSFYDDLYSRYKDDEKLSSIIFGYMRLLFSTKIWAYYNKNDKKPFFNDVSAHLKKHIRKFKN